MARIFYTITFYFLLPFILLRLLWRARKSPDYGKRWSERFAWFKKPTLKKHVIWVHAVSVGESLAAAPLIEQLIKRYPQSSVVVTTTTPTGSDRILSLFGKQPKDRVFHVYCPYDLPDCLSRFFKRIKPSIFIIMETELWPNTIAHCKKNNVPIVLANGRLSEKSAKGYQKLSWLIRPVFETIIAAAQTQDDGSRMQRLGLPSENCHLTGSIKFDLNIDEALRKKAETLKLRLNSPVESRVLIAASTHEGEEAIVLEAFKKIKQTFANSFLIIVPRHPERFNTVGNLIKESGLHYNRRSDGRVEVESDVLLGDTMGELLLLLGASDTAFVGGSLVPVGGHNLMEPAAWGLPIFTGNHLFNFAEVSRLLVEGGALEIVDTADSLAASIISLWQNQNELKQRRESSLAIAKNNRGALDKLLVVIEQTIAGKSNDRLD